MSERERDLVDWLLRNGEPDAAKLLPQLAEAQVVGRCACGCASVDFSVNGRIPEANAKIRIISDFWWRAEAQRIHGVFVFARGDQLAGLEVWSVDGGPSAESLPDVAWLRPFSHAFDL